MAYVLKNDQGAITALSTSENPGAGWVEIADDSAEYKAYLEDSMAKSSAFRESDIQLVRVLEDLISLLIERDVIRFTDLPPMAQTRLNDRESMRKKTGLSNLLGEKDDFII